MIDEKEIIELIKQHKQDVAGYDNDPMSSGYKLAHDHIIEIIEIYAKHRGV